MLPRLPTLPALALLALLAGAVRSQELYLYGVTESGRVTVNATVLDKLSSSIKSNSPVASVDPTRWIDVYVNGSNRWVLRVDGRVMKNGSKHAQLAFTDVVLGAWVSMAGNGDSFWALRSDGLLNNDGASVIDLPQEGLCPPPEEPPPAEGDGEPVPCDFYFADVVHDGTSAWVLRADGAVFQHPSAAPGQAVFELKGGAGLEGDYEGAYVDTVWVNLAIDPVTGKLAALRRDGKVLLLDPADADPVNPPAGTLSGALPFGAVANAATVYSDLEFTADGKWWALRGDGAVFVQDVLVDPFVELPGSPDSSLDAWYMDLLPVGESWFAVRWDGRLFQKESGTEVSIVLASDRYRRLAWSDQAPDLTNFKNNKPVTARYQVQAVSGQPVTFPVLATDTDKAAAELIVQMDMETIPEGASFDGGTRLFTWDDPGPAGKVKLLSYTDDLLTKKPTKAKHAIRVRDPDDDPEKNKPPRVAKIKNVQALVAIPLELPLVASDEDGDELTWSVNEDKPPFTLGASFDPETAVFSWTPKGADIGKHTVTFLCSDGTKTVKRKVKIVVRSSILAF